MEQKKILRNHLKKKRHEISVKDKSVWDQQILKQLLTIISDNSSIVAIYYPKGSEINLLKILETRQHILLPKISGKKLEFSLFKKYEDLVLNPKFQIYEPKINAQNLIPGIIVCPMLAFDRKMHRLGYGGGYYDRTIEELQSLNHNIKIIGVAYSFQEVKKIPKEEHDQKLDYIITEKEVISDCL